MQQAARNLLTSIGGLFAGDRQDDAVLEGVKDESAIAPFNYFKAAYDSLGDEHTQTNMWCQSRFEVEMEIYQAFGLEDWIPVGIAFAMANDREDLVNERVCTLSGLTQDSPMVRTWLHANQYQFSALREETRLCGGADTHQPSTAGIISGHNLYDAPLDDAGRVFVAIAELTRPVELDRHQLAKSAATFYESYEFMALQKAQHAVSQLMGSKVVTWFGAHGFEISRARMQVRVPGYQPLYAVQAGKN